MKKRFLAVLLTLCMICVSTAGISASAYCTPSHYSDVSTSATYYPAACYLRDHGLMVGTSYNVFSPNDPVTRGQMVTIIWRMFNKPEPDGTVTSFPDCYSSDYYYNAVRWASSSNVRIAFGHDDGKFYPNTTLTQQDAFVFLYRAICYAKYLTRTTALDNTYKSTLANSPLTYRGSVTDYAKPAFGWAYDIGLTLTNSVNPLSKAPRQDFAQYVYKVIKEYQKKYALTVSQHRGIDQNTNQIKENDLPSAPNGADAMAALFQHNGADTKQRSQIERSAFGSAMSSAFGNAKPLDMCYLYLAAHGNGNGIVLFNSEVSSGTALTPQQLRNYINSYKGSFVVFIYCCYSGTFIGQSLGDVTNEYIDDTSSLFDEVFSELPTDTSELPTDTSELPTDTSELPADTSELPADTSELPTDTSELPADTSELPADTSELPTDISELPADTLEPSNDVSISTNPEPDSEFDADWFARVLSGEEDSDDGTAGTLAANLADPNNPKKIRVLCSSRSDEESLPPDLVQTQYDLATKYWCLGAGYNVSTSYFGSLKADTNKDARISLKELHQYAAAEVSEHLHNLTPITGALYQNLVCYPANDTYIILETSY